MADGGCKYPITAYKVEGERKLAFRLLAGMNPIQEYQIPCGKCIGCRLERSTKTATRIMHEASLYDFNCFLTLTYDEQHLPPWASLDHRHFQLFMKRTREWLRRRNTNIKLRFYMCGEYGENLGRPHYHAIIFNFDFLDKLYFKAAGKEGTLYTSDTLRRLWGMGHTLIGDVTFNSAAYVARYCIDKINGDQAKAHYAVIDQETGEIHQRTPEYTRSSNQPGIGAPWFAKYASDVYPHGSVIINGHNTKPPRYYAKLYERFDPEAKRVLAELETSNFHRAQKTKGDNTPERLRVKEQVQLARLRQLKRHKNLGDET